jgi:hypothetical protein
MITRGRPVVNVTLVSDGAGPEVSSTTADGSGTTRTAVGPAAAAPAAARPPHAAARQSQLARPHRLRDIPLIDPLPA